MKKFSLFLLIVWGLIGISCGEADQQSEDQTSLVSIVRNAIEKIDPATFAAKIAEVETPQIVDLRTVPEVAEGGHLDNMIHIDFNAGDLEKQFASLDKDKPVFVYCAKGGRSARCASLMEEKGFAKIYDMEGGYTAWKAAGLPIVGEKAE